MFRKHMKLTEIKISDERRPVHDEVVKSIADSFRLCGQLHPILVDEEGNLIAGRHRIAAAKLCEWTTIEAGVMEAGDVADLAEIDENLQRHNLDQLYFSRAVAARKKLWERVNEMLAQRGAKPKKGGNLEKIAPSPPEQPSANEETAKVTGVSVRTVERAVAIGEKLTKEAEEIVKDTPVADNATALAAIAAEPPKKQKAAARAAVAGKKPEKPPPEEKPVVDGLKGPVDGDVLDAFRFAAEWKELMQTLSNAKAALTKICEHDTSCWLDKQETERLISQARANLKFAAPFTECCKCRRKVKKDCTHCRGRGWLTKSAYESCASDADKAWLEARSA